MAINFNRESVFDLRPINISEVRNDIYEYTGPKYTLNPG